MDMNRVDGCLALSRAFGMFQSCLLCIHSHMMVGDFPLKNNPDLSASEQKVPCPVAPVRLLTGFFPGDRYPHVHCGHGTPWRYVAVML